MTFSQLLSDFKTRRVLVVGDLMLDEYIFGRATRISPEAPVIVVKKQRTAAVPGGAANVARNLAAFGAATSVVGVVGADAGGSDLEAALGEFANVELARDPERPTTRKTRVIANHSHQVVRIDEEIDSPVSAALEADLLAKATALLEGVNVLLISDYGKGGVTEGLTRGLIAAADSAGVPVVANPKPKSLSRYAGARLVSLNRFEAGDSLGVGAVSDEDARSAAEALRSRLGVGAVLITLGGSGMAAAWEGGSAQVPAVRVEVYDEAGAGDTAIATIALGVAGGHLGEALLALATHTAGAVVQKVGVAAPSDEDLARIASL